MKYVLHLKYDGNKLNGFATQPHKNTVEDKLNDVLSRITGEEIKVKGSARTDSRVHALDSVVMFESVKEMDLGKLKFSINSLIGNDIYAFDVYNKEDDFHVRYHMQSKTYMYQISTEYNPFLRTYSYYHRKKIDIEMLNKQAQVLVGTHDFKAFCASKATAKTTVRTINYINVTNKDNVIRIYINANGFLYNMVRIIVGTLLDYNDGKLSDDLETILKSKNRRKAGLTAPPEGLFLYKSIF